MKKLLLTLGTVASVAAPIAAVVSCGSENKTEAPKYYSEYKMRDIGEMTNKAELTTFLTSNPSTGTTVAFESAIDANTTFTAAEKTMLKKIVEHYKTTDHKVETAWHVLNFANASTDATQIALAVMGWLYNGQTFGDLQTEASDPDQNIVNQANVKIAAAKNEVKQYILNGTIDIKDIAQSIISKFSGEDKHFDMATVGGALTPDPVAKTLTKGVMASFAIQAMGGDDTLGFILQHGAGWTLV